MSRGYPYRLPSKDVVRAHPWALVTERGDEPLAALLPTWDYGMDLSLRRTMSIDLDRIREEASVEPGADLAVGVYWSAGRLRGQGSRDVIHAADGDIRVELSVDLRGWEIGGTLGLHTIVFLLDEVEPEPGPVVWRAGSELWADRKSTKLQGDVPRFPVAVVDVAAQGYPSGAPWVLDLQSDLAEPTLGSLHLLVNEDDQPAVDAVASAGGDDGAARVLLGSMHYDVGRTLIDLALGHDELEDDAEYPEESLGRTLKELLQRVFPDMPLRGIRDLRNTDPARYSGQILAALRPVDRDL